MIMVSVIIPVYNAEKYIEECLDSLLGQTYSDFEIICVDDGSKDHSLEILRRYEALDGRILVLTQKNQYAGVARNVGMKWAKGKYLLFLDADDFFCEDMLEQTVKKAEEGHTEILVFDAYRYDEASGEINAASWSMLSAELFGEGIHSAAQIADSIYQFTSPSPWKLFLKEHIEKNELQFQKIKRANDLFFTFAALSCAERIGILNHKLMYYRTGNAQSLQGSVDDTPDVYALAVYALRDFLKSRNLWRTFQTAFQEMAVTLCVYNLGKLRTEEAYLYLLEKLKNDVMPQLEIELERPDRRLGKAVRNQEKIIIYGAGMLASVFVRLLMMKYEYERNHMLIVVSSKQNNVSELCGVSVQELQEISDEYKEYLTVIAISKEAVQKEVEIILQAEGFTDSLKLGFREMLSFVAYGTETEI